MIAGILIGKLCIVAAVAAVALVLEVVVPILRQRRLERKLAENSADIAPARTENEVKAEGAISPLSGQPKEEANPPLSTSTSDLHLGQVEDLAFAERFWVEARGMIHSETPDFSTDWQYMTLVHKAAELGHLEAMSKLGDYAFKRGDVVEAFYWKLRVEMNGGRCRNPTLADIIQLWTEEGCPEEYDNVTAGFSEEQGVFARAVLRLKSGVDPQYAGMRLKELADAGDEDAMRFLKRR